nr:O-antigen translocase [Sphingomonas arenae]
MRSSTIVGGASLVNVALSLFRMKAAALILGPAGVGLIGLLQNLIATGSTFAALGLGGAATRQLAAEGLERQADIRRALFWAGLWLSAATILLLLAFREPLARLLLPDAGWSSAMPWIAAGTALALIASLQLGIITGLRRIGDVAHINILSGAAATVAGVAALFILGEQGIPIFVLSVPLAGALLGWHFLRRLPAAPAAPAAQRTPVAHHWRQMVPLGAAIMIGGLLTTGSQLAVRAMVGDQLGLPALGHFHAAWTISMTYLGLVLQAMGTDFYPRLSARIADRPAASRLVAEQAEVALLLGAPILLAMMAAAPLALQLLYAAEFREAAATLRWQILGDLLKVAAWPLGFVLLAASRSRAHIALEALAQAVFVGATVALLPRLGLQASGIAFFLMYAVYLPAVALAAHRTLGSSTHLRALQPLLWLTPALMLVMAATWISPVIALLVGALLALASAAHAYRRLHHALPAPLTRFIEDLRRPSASTE